MLARFDYFSITAHPEVLVLQHNQFINVLKNAMLLIFSNISGVALVICYNSIVSFFFCFFFFFYLSNLRPKMLVMWLRRVFHVLENVVTALPLNNNC